MIGIDANVLLRYLVRDNAEQAGAAETLLEELTPDSPGFICREVMLEVAWTLERTYRRSREEVSTVVLDLTARDNLVVEAGDDVARAAVQYRRGGPGFADRMILGAAARAGAAPLYTFDRRLAREAGAELMRTS